MKRLGIPRETPCAVQQWEGGQQRSRNSKLPLTPVWGWASASKNSRLPRCRAHRCQLSRKGAGHHEAHAGEVFFLSHGGGCWAAHCRRILHPSRLALPAAHCRRCAFHSGYR